MGRPGTSRTRAAISSAIFGLLTVVWLAAFLLEMLEITHNVVHASYNGGLSNVSPICRWINSGDQWQFLLHCVVVGSMTVYALWLRSGDFASAVARVFFYELFWVASMLMLFWSWDVCYASFSDMEAWTALQAVAATTAVVLGVPMVALALFLLTRGRVFAWMLVLLPICIMLAATFLFTTTWPYMTEYSHTPLYPTPRNFVIYVLAVAGVMGVLRLSSKLLRVPPDGTSAILLAGLIGLAAAHLLLLGLATEWHYLIKDIGSIGITVNHDIIFACIFVPVEVTLAVLIRWAGRRDEAVETAGPDEAHGTRH